MDEAQRKYWLLVAAGRMPELQPAARDHVLALLRTIPGKGRELATMVMEIGAASERIGYDRGWDHGYAEAQGDADENAPLPAGNAS